MQKAQSILQIKSIQLLWKKALETKWKGDPLWIHGDLVKSNLLLQRGQLHAVIDFGMLGVGDPACDLTLAWTEMEPSIRDEFFQEFDFDEDVFLRAKAWGLWKLSIIAAGMMGSHVWTAREAHMLLERLCTS